MAYFSLAVTYEKQGDIGKARQCYKKAASGRDVKQKSIKREILE
jgi:Tfp pilus assembly protein PilF